MPPLRAFDLITNQPWAITQDALQTILSVASREPRDLEAVQAQLGRPLQNTRKVTIRGDTAVIPILGPIFRRANLFTELSGATSIEILAQDFSTALRDPAVRAIVLDIDSPGGAVSGVNELSSMIYAARGAKPIIAYVGNQMASAAYWIGSAADKIIIDATAMVGSIGVIAALYNDHDPSEVKFTSRNSPNKLPDPGTTQGRSQIQDLIDATYDVFVKAVARNRGVPVDKVQADYGAGGMLVGQSAVDAGLADEIGSLEGVLTSYEGTRIYTPARNAVVNTASRVDEQQRSADVVPAMRSDRLPITTNKEQIMTELNTTEVAQADTVAPPIMPPIVPPIDSAAAQAQVSAYVAQLRAQYEEERKHLLAEAQAQFQREIAEMRAQQAITAYAQDVTTPTLQRQHALPFEASRLVTFLTGLNATQRTEAQSLFSHILDAGLVSFEELGSSAEGDQPELTAQEEFDSAVLAKMSTGLSRLQAIEAVRREKPQLYDAYRAESSAQARSANGKGGR